MFVIKRNQVIITALVIMIAVAGYLNYVDAPRREQEATAMADDYGLSELMDSTAIMPDGTIATESLTALVPNDMTEEAISTLPDGDLYTTDADEGELSELQADEVDSSAAVFVNSQTDSTYFVQAKLDREQARSKEKDILTEVINNQNVDKETKAKSAESMLEIQKRIEKESAAESMIEAKGFKEAYVRISEDSVDVVVSKEALTQAEIAQIEDIVKRKTGMAIEQIRISPLKK